MNSTFQFTTRLYTGPVLSRFDRILLIGPRAKGGLTLCLLNKADLTEFFLSGPAPKGASHFVYLTKQTYSFYRSCLCILPARSSVFF